MSDWLLTLLNHSWLPWSGAFLLAALGIYAWWSLLNRHIRPAHQQLQERLAACNQDPAAALALFEVPLGHVSAASPPLSLSGLLGVAWQERHLQEIPNRFLAVGIFFTLLGLLAAVATLNRELQAPVLLEAKASLQTLLQVTVWKFLTTVSAFLVAALYGRAVRWHSEQLAQQIGSQRERLQEQLAYRAERARHLPFVGVEPVMVVEPSLPVPESAPPLQSEQPMTSTVPATEAPVASAEPVATPEPVLVEERHLGVGLGGGVALPLAQLAGAFLQDQQQRRARSLVKAVRRNG
ncbi:MAG: hypothetical protein HQM04_01825 [Magnetococcales bacterium]|nr:hypothetical protein [Magnetococcales bacterium]MBF0113758.1 hypothetical protein [Magnetococcales bacterium]